jgi:hypothetical protein
VDRDKGPETSQKVLLAMCWPIWRYWRKITVNERARPETANPPTQSPLRFEALAPNWPASLRGVGLGVQSRSEVGWIASETSLHRCLKRHGISRLPEIAGDKVSKKPNAPSCAPPPTCGESKP